MSAKPKLPSIEEAPLIRKFSVLFIVASVVPFVIIGLLFVQISSAKTVITEEALVKIIILLGVGALSAFYSMRASILKISRVTQQATKTLSLEFLELRSREETGESEITQLTRTFNEITKNLEENIRRLEESRRTMQYVLSKLAVGIASLQNVDMFLELIVEITTNALDAKSGILMILDEKTQELYIKNASGVEEKYKSLRLKTGEDIPGWVLKHRKPILIPKIKMQKEEGFFEPPLVCAPMLFQERLIGVLTVAGKRRGESFEEDELAIVSNLASQTAIALENERLNEDAEKTYLETISALAMAVEARDPYSRGHSDRVARYAINIAEKLGLDRDLISDIKSAAQLHDVGKIGISDFILKKPERLTEEEMGIMRQHTIIGEGIVKPVRSLSRLCGIIRHHHEFLDGSGYPDGLKGDQIPLGAKILIVSDSFDAMTIDRPYCKALSFEEAKAELRKFADIRYDRKVVEAFLSVI